MAQKSRSELKGLFLKGSKPSQEDFADFIESTLNFKDDGIEKAGADTPLKITAQGDDEKLLEFLDKNGGSSWSISQKSGDKQGFNISNSSGDSRLFIDSSSGNVELSGDLTVNGTISGTINAANISGVLAGERIPNLSGDKITSGVLEVERIPELSGDKITSGVLEVERIPNLSADKITSGVLEAERIPNLSGDKITSGVLEAERIPNLSADKITSGVLEVERIPNLSGDKITSGILEVERIPNLSGDKITSGILEVERIPELSGDKITSGILEVERIPNLSADKITSGVLAVARIPNLSANKITSGTINGIITFNEVKVNEKITLSNRSISRFQTESKFNKNHNAVPTVGAVYAYIMNLMNFLTFEKEIKFDLGNKIFLDLVHIPGGNFFMGSPQGEGRPDEHPQHEVTVPPFYMGKYPVTVEQWFAVMHPDQPTARNMAAMGQVSWDDCYGNVGVSFCHKLTEKLKSQGNWEFRLPSEAEWEYACRAETTTTYYFGDNENDLSDYAWHYGNSPETIQPVGKKKPNEFGLYDMYGNVWEWCLDIYHDNYNDAPNNGSPWTDLVNNIYRIRRGGSTGDPPNSCRSAARNQKEKNADTTHSGFRVVCGF